MNPKVTSRQNDERLAPAQTRFEVGVQPDAREEIQQEKVTRRWLKPDLNVGHDMQNRGEETDQQPG